MQTVETKTKIIQREIRRVAIDILQCGNYIDWSKTESARTNLHNNILNLKKILDLIEQK